jgi:hypothetical protein
MFVAVPSARLVIGNAVAVGAPGTADHAKMQKGAVIADDPTTPVIMGVIIRRFACGL